MILKKIRMKSQIEFPRKLSGKEKELIFYLLPEDRTGYQEYRKKISDYYILGFGKFGEGNLMLGEIDDAIDLSMPSAPVFAAGKVKTDLGEIYIVIHEEFENQIEIDLADPRFLGIDDFKFISAWTYSSWKPGMKNPADNKNVREVHIIKNKLVVAISVSDKKIWVYDEPTGVNHLIPVTKFYDELMRIKQEKDPKIALNASLFFKNLNTFSDELIARTFFIYNKYAKKIEIDLEKFSARKRKKKSFLKLFKRG